MLQGIIKRLVKDKGFGFITPDGEQTDVFFHTSEVQGMSFDELAEGQRVSFETEDSPKGPRAKNVQRI